MANWLGNVLFTKQSIGPRRIGVVRLIGFARPGTEEDLYRISSIPIPFTGPWGGLLGRAASPKVSDSGDSVLLLLARLSAAAELDEDAHVFEGRGVAGAFDARGDRKSVV